LELKNDPGLVVGAGERELLIRSLSVSLIANHEFDPAIIALRNDGSIGLTANERLELARKYSPDQPRDDHGRFGEGIDDSTNSFNTAIHGTIASNVTDIFKKGLKLGSKWNGRPKSVYFVKDHEHLQYFVTRMLLNLGISEALRDGRVSYQLQDGRILSKEEYSQNEGSLAATIYTVQYAEVKFKIPDTNVLPDVIDKNLYNVESYRIEKPVKPENIISATIYERQAKHWEVTPPAGVEVNSGNWELSKWKPIGTVDNHKASNNFGYTIVYLTLSEDTEKDGLKYSPDQPRDDHGRFGEGSSSATVEVDGNGYGVVKDNVYAGVSDNEWQDWAHFSAEVNDARDGALKVGDVDSSGGRVTEEDVTQFKDLGDRIQAAAEANYLKGTFAVFRGESYTSLDEATERYARNKLVTFPNLTSVTTSPEPARDYAQEGVENGATVRVLLAFQQRGGIQGVQTAPLGVPSNEVVMPAGSSFRVVGVKKGADSLTVELYQRAEPKGQAVIDRFSSNQDYGGRAGLAKLFKELKYSPDQPRDEHGRFGEVEGEATATAEQLNNVMPESSQAYDDERLPAELKHANMVRIGTHLAFAAQTNPELKEQLDRVYKANFGEAARNEFNDSPHSVYTIDHMSSLSSTTKGAYYLADHLQGAWAYSSASTASQVMQTAVADKFGIDNPFVLPSFTSEEIRTPSGQRREYTNLGIEIPFGLSSREELLRTAASSPAIKAYVDFVYKSTQMLLKGNNIESVEVYRGISFSRSLPAEFQFYGDTKRADVNLRPLSSFSSNESIALNFAVESKNSGFKLTSVVPAARIFSVPKAGLGSLDEKEFVIIGGKIRASIYREN
jgi:hypothetical protein